MRRKRGTDFNGPETWGSRFQQRRDALGLSQHQVAALAEVTQQCVSRFENDEVDPRFSTLEKLARAVAMDVNRIFPTDLRPRGETVAARKAASQKTSARSRRKGAPG